MKRILVFQHVAHEILGTFHPLLKEAGFRIRYANFGREPHPDVDVKKYDGLIILGGPMGVYEASEFPHLHYEMKCIREAVERHKPVLGICLGAQLIACALGAAVTRAQETEIGWYDVHLTPEGQADPILGGLAPTEKIFQWHGDTFEIPPGAVWLARSARCPHQAFRYRDNVYGFQFHLEVDEPMIERWLKVPVNHRQLECFGGETLETRIRNETPRFISHHKELSRRIFGAYIARFSSKRRTLVLGSGHKSGHK